MENELNKLRRENKRLQKELNGTRALLQAVRQHANYAANNLADSDDLRDALELMRDTIDHNTPGLIKVTIPVERGETEAGE